jgi:two-component system, NarL family, sensor histidine kinase UhpB
MWQKLSLRARLNVLLALVLMLGLLINISRLLLEAAPRVQAEDQSVVRLAREFVQTLVVGLDDTKDPEARLGQIVEDLKRLRHVSIRRAGIDGEGPASIPMPAADTGAGDDADAPPAWFVALVHPEQTTVRVPVVARGQSLGSLVITSHPDDEMAEIWDGIVTQVEVGAAIAAVLFLITMTVVGRALAPLSSLADAMTHIESGRYDIRVKPAGSPELATICRKLNHLAATLNGAVEDRERLAERIVTLQDAERKEIARELHDEFGPYLFALRAHATALKRVAENAEPDMIALRKHGGAMLDQVNALQQFNRRVLERLRPAGLAELGLREALTAQFRLWRDVHPDVVVNATISPSLGVVGETADLTIYRTVQEALTNAFRHSGATRIDVTVEPAHRSVGVGPGRSEATLVRVRDNGSGLSVDHKLGLGLTGMRERVMALGGNVTVASADGGVTVEAVIPGDACCGNATADGRASRAKTLTE